MYWLHQAEMYQLYANSVTPFSCGTLLFKHTWQIHLTAIHVTLQQSNYNAYTEDLDIHLYRDSNKFLRDLVRQLTKAPLTILPTIALTARSTANHLADLSSPFEMMSNSIT